MKPDVSPLHVSLVDIVVASFAGAAWLMAFATLYRVVIVKLDKTPVDVVLALLAPPGLTATPSLIVYYVGLGLVSYALGIALDKVAVDSCDWVVSRVNKTQRFPYDNEFERVLSVVTMKLTSLLGNEYRNLPDFRPFSSCKRVIRSTSPSLWAESEQLEARVRALGSLWATAAFSALVAVAGIARGQTPCPFAVTWLVGSIIFVAVLGQAFRHARHREVQNTYMNFLLAVSSTSITESGREPK